MAQLFKVHTIQLTKQLVTASGDNLLYVNGNPVVVGVSGALNQTGLYLVSQIAATGSQAWNAANNNGINLSGNLTLTGQTLRALTLGGDTNLSGQLTVTGQTLYQIVTGLSGQAVTDYATKIQLNNLSGFTTGLSGYLQVQINEANADVSSINGQSGVLVLTGTGGLTVISGGVGLILISGDNSISGALTQTGVTLGTKIDSLSGYVGNVSGGLEARITATGNAAVVHANGIGINLSGNLTATGQTLYQMMTGLSGQANINYATVANLALTGSNLYVTLTGLSGQAVIDYATKTNLTLTGQTLLNAIIGGDTNLSGNLTLTGQTLRALTLGGDTNLSGNLAQTGSTLSDRINSLSGYTNTQDYLTGLAAILYASGISGVLNTSIIATGNSGVLHSNGIGVNLSGNLTQTGVNLLSVIANTGSQAWNAANNNAINLSGALTQTGALLSALRVTGSAIQNTLNLIGTGTVQGWISGTNLYISGNQADSINISGSLEQTGAALVSLIAQTGQQAWLTAQNNALNLSGNLAQTGATLLSVIAQTGQGSILYTNGASGALQSYINSVSGFVDNVSGGLEARITQTGVAAINHANSIGQTISGNLTQTGSTLDNKINSLSGFVGNISGGLEIRIAQTGSAAVVHANGIGTIISGNVTQTGVTLLGFIIGGDTNLSGNLTQTGSTLNTRINSLSGWADQIFVHRTGQELISGRKIFTSSPALTGIEFAGASGSGVYASVQTDGVVSFAGPSGGLLSIDSGVNGSVFAITNQYEAPYLDIYEDGRIYVGGFLSNTLFVSGSGAAFGVNYVPSGYNLFVSGNAQYIGNIYSGTTGGQVINIADLFYPRLTNPSGYVTGATLIATGSSLYVMLTGMSGAFNIQVQSTGQQAWSAANNNALNLSGNLTQTGVILRALTLGGDTNLSGNLTLTGQTLLTRIDSLSGYAAPARADYFYRTGIQTISGNTTIQGNLTIISGQYEPQKTVSANYSVLSTDSRIYCNNGNPITLTLPSLASVSGQIVNVKLVNTGSVILTGTAGQLFDGSPSYVIVGQYQSRQIHGGDATNWYLW